MNINATIPSEKHLVQIVNKLINLCFNSKSIIDVVVTKFEEDHSLRWFVHSYSPVELIRININNNQIL